MNKKVRHYLSFILMLLGVAYSISPAGSAAIALAYGVFFAVVMGNPYQAHTKKYSQKLLAYSIVGLGAGMNLVTVAQAGLSGIGYTIVSISLTLALGLFMGKIMKSDPETSLLVTVGTAICGGSAIAAIAPAIKAKPHSISVSLGVVFLLNAAALFIFPGIGHYFGLSQKQFGLWSALAIHDTSSVVGAGLQYGAEALQVGTTVKLARALWIVPLTFIIVYLTQHKNPHDIREKTKKPWFIFGFLLMAAVVTWVPGAQIVGRHIEALARKGLMLTLFFIGSNLTMATLRSVGLRPLLQGIVLWITVSVSTLVFCLYQ